MSTNYYHRTNCCGECNRYDERHIGSLSCGWQFSFRAYESLNSWQEWREVIESGGEVRDEYDKPLTPKEFVSLVEQSMGKLDHIEYCKRGKDYERKHIETALANKSQFHDKDGCSFSTDEFS